VLVSKRYTEHLKSKSLAPEVGQLVDMILTELTQVSDLVQTTSSYAEGKTILRTAVTGINAVLQDFVSRMDQFITARHCKIYFEPDKDFNVKIDTKEFFQCFQHIVKNACDAMPDGGTLKIATKIDGKLVKIIFEDQGLGIPESFIDKIFEPFMTHGKKEGAGLGLSITKKIVEAHQGTIEVRSSLGAGAVFTITLPAGA
jgi:signal transduction histidine kinase